MDQEKEIKEIWRLKTLGTVSVDIVEIHKGGYYERMSMWRSM